MFANVQEEEEFFHGREHPWAIASQMEWMLYRDRNAELIAEEHRKISEALDAGKIAVVDRVDVHGPFDEVMGSVTYFRAGVDTLEEANAFISAAYAEPGGDDLNLTVVARPVKRSEPATAPADAGEIEIPF